ncbi:hypothetical protein CA13_03380 [Planctomycetes bacterium CA13]|uniref:Uncharacterized protein n=1 Tax=Novipirellula herctigrandis TaxID=2527986 RepID=A0A5C5YW03_9BACT|nr:hypothetical protein CA13_03380 [Planctomycetes bacterium CA13]
MIAEHRIGQAIDCKNPRQKLQSITNPATAMLIGLTGKRVFATQECTSYTALNCVEYLNFCGISDFIAWFARHNDLLDKT